MGYHEKRAKKYGYSIDIMKNHPMPSFYPFAKLHGCQQRSKGCRAAQDLTKERHITRHRVTRRHASRVTGEAGRKWGQFRWFHQGTMYQKWWIYI